MPALAIPLDLAVLHQLGHDAVQVVRLDLQLLGDLGNGDPRTRAHQVQGLGGTRIAGTPATRSTRAPARAAGAGGIGRAGRTAGATAAPDEGSTGSFEPDDLLLELAQSAVDVLDGAVNEVSQVIQPPCLLDVIVQGQDTHAYLRAC